MTTRTTTTPPRAPTGARTGTWIYLGLALGMSVTAFWGFSYTYAPAAAQERLPILDVRLHAVPANHLGPPPRAVCTPMPSPAWDPSRPYGELFDRLAKEPPCPDPVWSPMTDEALMNETIEVMSA